MFSFLFSKGPVYCLSPTTGLSIGGASEQLRGSLRPGQASGCEGQFFGVISRGIRHLDSAAWKRILSVSILFRIAPWL